MPMPPSINQQLMPAWAQRRFIKTKEAREFDSQFEAWMWENKSELKYASASVRDLASKGNILALDLNFYFPEDQLFTKKDTIKQLDLNNRMKSAIDAVSKAIGVDDSIFFSHLAQKMVSQDKLSHFSASIYKLSPERFLITRTIKAN